MFTGASDVIAGVIQIGNLLSDDFRLSVFYRLAHFLRDASAILGFRRTLHGNRTVFMQKADTRRAKHLLYIVVVDKRIECVAAPALPDGF